MNIDEQKTRFLGICRETIHREGLEELLDWLLKADFFTAPASTRYHGAYSTNWMFTQNMEGKYSLLDESVAVQNTFSRKTLLMMRCTGNHDFTYQ